MRLLYDRTIFSLYIHKDETENNMIHLPQKLTMIICVEQN